MPNLSYGLRANEHGPIGECVIFLFEKKRMHRVSSPGRAPPARERLKGEGKGEFFTQNVFLSSKKRMLTGSLGFPALGHHFSTFFDSILHFYSSPTRDGTEEALHKEVQEGRPWGKLQRLRGIRQSLVLECRAPAAF